MKREFYVPVARYNGRDNLEPKCWKKERFHTSEDCMEWIRAKREEGAFTEEEMNGIIYPQLRNLEPSLLTFKYKKLGGESYCHRPNPNKYGPRRIVCYSERNGHGMWEHIECYLEEVNGELVLRTEAFENDGYHWDWSANMDLNPKVSALYKKILMDDSEWECLTKKVIDHTGRWEIDLAGDYYLSTTRTKYKEEIFQVC